MSIGKDMDKSKVSRFLAHPVHILYQLGNWPLSVSVSD